MGGSVELASASPHGNHVIQKIVKVMPPGSIKFIVEELSPCAIKTARSRYGCRILSRLIERSSEGITGITELVDVLLPEARELCKDEFAHYVMESIVEHGTVAAQRDDVLDALESVLREQVDNKTALYTFGSMLHALSSDRR